MPSRINAGKQIRIVKKVLVKFKSPDQLGPKPKPNFKSNCKIFYTTLALYLGEKNVCGLFPNYETIRMFKQQSGVAAVAATHTIFVGILCTSLGLGLCISIVGNGSGEKVSL